jgi:hypothetical protein
MEEYIDKSSTEEINRKEDINRKEAIKKMGKYAALTAMGTFLILNPQKAQATSAPSKPGEWGF